MGSHPVNLAVRLLLEIAALIALGRWGWVQGEGFLRYVLALGIPILAAVLWGTLAVPDDPSRSGRAPIKIAGWIRLLLELGFFGLAALALFRTSLPSLGWALGIAVLVHYVLSYDRILWLFKQ
jgi:hypothetical protein